MKGCSHRNKLLLRPQRAKTETKGRLSRTKAVEKAVAFDTTHIKFSARHAPYTPQPGSKGQQANRVCLLRS